VTVRKVFHRLPGNNIDLAVVQRILPLLPATATAQEIALVHSIIEGSLGSISTKEPSALEMPQGQRHPFPPMMLALAGVAVTT
jgi:hypothetical protein